MEAVKKCPCPSACASLWRLPSLFGDDTHAVGTRPKWAREHVIHIYCGSLCRWVASLAHRQVLETGTRANVNVRPRPLAQRTGKEKEIKKERKPPCILTIYVNAWKCALATDRDLWSGLSESTSVWTCLAVSCLDPAFAFCPEPP